MRFNLITLFPDFFDSPLATGLMGKAANKGVVDVSRINPRDFTVDAHRTVDDRPYGGGPGMVMMLDPLVKAIESLPDPGRLVLMTPKGAPLTQSKAAELAGERTLTVICGRYEGIDARLERLLTPESISVGDFVLNGGETAALCLLEAVSRHLPGFLGTDASMDTESFSGHVLEHPQFTRPEEYRGERVPEVLLSGDHAKIAAWRRTTSLCDTLDHRPDLLAKAHLSVQDMTILRNMKRPRLGRLLFPALLHSPVKNKSGQTSTVSLTNLDIHDIGRVSRSYDLGGYFVATPLADQQVLARRLIEHWTEGPGLEAIPERAEALRLVRVAHDLDDVVFQVTARCGVVPKVVCTSAQGEGSHSMEEVRDWLRRGPIVLVFGTASGLAPEVMKAADALLRPIRPCGGYNHLPVRSAASIVIDRLIGDVL